MVHAVMVQSEPHVAISETTGLIFSNGAIGILARELLPCDLIAFTSVQQMTSQVRSKVKVFTVGLQVRVLYWILKGKLSKAIRQYFVGVILI